MNKPTGVGLFFFPNSKDEFGSVEMPPLLRHVRPLTFGLWLIVFAIEIRAATTASGMSWLILGMSTALFAGVHIQFWLEESDQGRRVREGFERMRGQIYEDEETGLPNSRHFVFQLRRQMMRSVRNGRGFSIVLSTVSADGANSAPNATVLRSAGSAMKGCLGDCDFIARLQGSSFGAIVLDEPESTGTAKADLVKDAMAGVLAKAGGKPSVAVSITGYEGELEVRDFLRRAQRDLQSSQENVVHPGKPRRKPHAA